MKLCMQCMNQYPDEYEDICPHCGYVHGATENGGSALPPGTILQGRYIVGNVIKSRDMDLCYIGWDYLFERKVMIQEYLPRYCVSRSKQLEPSAYNGEKDGLAPSVYSSKEELYRQGLELFYRQSRELIRLYKEEDVVTYHACFKDHQTAYAVMEYRKNETLEQYLASRGTLRVREAMGLLAKAAESVEKAARLGILHGRIEPSSFWVEPNGNLVLKDFGAWRYISGEPGIVDYGRAGEHTDVYGLAKLFCQMVTGKEIEDDDKLEAELIKSQVRLSRHVTAALKRALAHQTRTIRQFEEELEGPVRRRLPGRGGEEKAAKKPMSKRMLLACGLGALVFVIAAGGAGFALLRHWKNAAAEENVQLVRVPNVINMDVDEANRLLVSHGLKINKEDAKFSDEIAKDRISYQDQKEGTMVEAGTVIKVEVSKGKESYALPVVFGLSAEEAQAALTEAGFANVSLEDSEEDGAFDTVIGVSINGTPQITPEAGESGDNRQAGVVAWLEQLFAGNGEEAELVEKDAQILLTICKKEPELADVQNPVPDVSGKSAKEASEVLTEAGFQVNLTTEHSEKAEGTVISQEPAAGEMAAASAFVTVKVSLGPEMVIVPDVRFMDVEKAEKTLEENGLVLGGPQEMYHDEVAEGLVISQALEPDTEVAKGQKIVVQVSLGPDPNKNDGDGQESKESSGGTKQTPAASQRRPSSTPAPTPAPTQPPTQAPTQPPSTPAPTPEETPPETQQLPDAEKDKTTNNSGTSNQQNSGNAEVKKPGEPISGNEPTSNNVIDRTTGDKGGPGSENTGNGNSGGQAAGAGAAGNGNSGSQPDEPAGNGSSGGQAAETTAPETSEAWTPPALAF